MTKYIKEHPLASVMVAAVTLRVLATIFSKGYMSSDDHFETVHIAYNWLQNGLWGADGYLHWKSRPAGEFPRFPLYTVALYLNMEMMYALGCEALDKIMYGVRLGHALFSLIGVLAVYKTVEMVTKSQKWAAFAGLFMAAHFVMPYLAVRNRIEMVGGTFWVLAIYFVYRYRQDKQAIWLIVAGIITGLTWMIRFQMILAFGVVPLVLWFKYRSIKPALSYGLSLLVMFLLAGLVDLQLMGTFLGTSVNHLAQNLEVGAMYETSSLIYAAVILAYFIPPFSLIALTLASRKRFFSRHLVLTISTLVFIVVHTVLPNRQERFMIPIIPVLIVIIVLALHQHYTERGLLFRKRKLWYALLSFTLAVNMTLLIPFTFNYGHKGMVEPLVKVERISETPPRVLFFSPDKYRNVPYLYGGFHPIGRGYVYSWKDMDLVFPENGSTRFDYFLLYPLKAEDLNTYKDSLSHRVGPIEEVFHVRPSFIDYILRVLNPEHNPTGEAWVYRPVSG